MTRSETLYIEYGTLGSNTPWEPWGAKVYGTSADDTLKLRRVLERLRTLHTYRYTFRVVRKVVLTNIVPY